jgi:predicted ester cyclase
MPDLKKNKQLAIDFFEQIWNQDDESAIYRCIAEVAAGNDPKFGVGRESFRLQWRKWREAFPDINFAIEEIVTEGNTVVIRWHLTGTHKVECIGQPATGNKVAVDGVSIDRIDNGVVASGFDAWDEIGFQKQLKNRNFNLYLSK